MYNILSCSGFLESATTGLNFGSCFSARIGLVFLFFIIAIIRKWGAEEWGIDYSFWLSLLAGLLSYLIIVTISGSFRFAFLMGLLAALVIGYGAGYFIGGSDDGGDWG